MDYIIEYWKEKETNPIGFLSHFRCTTEPIGGGTEGDADGKLVNYFYWDFETITDEKKNTSSTIYWNQVRMQIALEMAKFISKEAKTINIKDLAARSVEFADALVEELKK